MSARSPYLASLLLLALAACGGGGSDPAPKLVYTNPTVASSGLTLVKNLASTDDSLVLDLVHGATGDAALSGTGISFALTVDATRANWVAGVSNGTAFQLISGTHLAKAWVNGGRIQGVVAQKGTAYPVNMGGSKVLATIRLTPVKGGPKGAVTLRDADLGSYIAASGATYPLAIKVGTLTLE